MNAEVPASFASRHYVDPDSGAPAVKLLPGEYYVTSGPHLLQTVLGSCVAACIHDPYAGLGGMNHFLLPDAADVGVSHADAMRYGEHAMEVLVRDILKAGARRERLCVKVFGGAAVLPHMRSLNVGDRNAQFVLRYLREQGIGVSAADLGGEHARRVTFCVVSGKVIVRRLRKAQELEQVGAAEASLTVRAAQRRAA